MINVIHDSVPLQTEVNQNCDMLVEHMNNGEFTFIVTSLHVDF